MIVRASRNYKIHLHLIQLNSDGGTPFDVRSTVGGLLAVLRIMHARRTDFEFKKKEKITDGKPYESAAHIKVNVN